MVKYKSNLNETVEEVIYRKRLVYDKNGIKNKHTDKYLITREIGNSEPDKFPVANTRISLIYEKEGYLRVWVPTLEEIIYGFERLYSRYAIHHLNILRELNYDPKSFDIINLKLEEVDYVMDEEIKRKSFGDSIPINVFYGLLKHIMISEDIRYSRIGQFGRDMIVLAIYDMIYNKVSMDELKSKYKLTNF